MVNRVTIFPFVFRCMLLLKKIRIHSFGDLNYACKEKMAGHTLGAKQTVC